MKMAQRKIYHFFLVLGAKLVLDFIENDYIEIFIAFSDILPLSRYIFNIRFSVKCSLNCSLR